MITVELHGMMADGELALTTVRWAERRALVLQGGLAHGMAGAPEATGIRSLFTKSVLHIYCKTIEALHRHGYRLGRRLGVVFTLSFTLRLKFFLARLFLVNHLQFHAAVEMSDGGKSIG